MGRKLKYAESELLTYAQQGLDNAEIAKKLNTQARNIAQRLRKIRSEHGIPYTGKAMEQLKPRPQAWNLRVGDTVNYKGGSRYMVKTVTPTEFTVQMVSYNAKLNKPPILTFTRSDYCSGKLRMRRVNLPPVRIYSLNDETEGAMPLIEDMTEKVAKEIEQFQADEMPCDDMYCDENEKGFCTTDKCVKQSVPIKDSGTRREFETGSVRDMQEGKGRCDLLPAAAILRLAKHYENGCKKYGDRNWEKGIPISSFIDSAIRHLMKYLDGQTDEDHITAAAWNCMCAMWTEEKKPDMQDIPSRRAF